VGSSGAADAIRLAGTSSGRGVTNVAFGSMTSSNATMRVFGGLTLPASSVPQIQFLSGTGAAVDVVAGGTLTATNGVIMPQLPWIPTNSVPASVEGNTNYLLVNLSNTVAGSTGGPHYIVTNTAAAGSFKIYKVNLTETTWP